MLYDTSVVYRNVAQLGRALRSGRRGRRFKSCHSDFCFIKKFPVNAGFFYAAFYSTANRSIMAIITAI